jgi:riboflavin biosynthesis pyrimidine reductase
VLTGIGTVQADNPQLTVRSVATPRQPLRVVVDRHAQTPRAAKVLEGGALIVTADGRNADWPDEVEHVALPDAQRRVALHAMMHMLGRRGINELHVEAGARLNAALLEAGLVDEVLAYIAPSLIGDPAYGIAQMNAPRAPAAAAPASTYAENPVDAEALLARCLNNGGLAVKLLDRFADSLRQTVLDLEANLTTRNWEVFTRAAHMLKGSSANLSADAVSAVAMELETLGKASDAELAAAQLERLRDEARRCLDFLPQAKAAVAGTAREVSPSKTR